MEYRALEQLIASFAPNWAANRAAARLRAQQAQRMLEVAQDTPYRKRPKGTQSANEVARRGAVAARSFARYLDENHDLSIGVLDLLETRITHGISVEPLTQDPRANVLFRNVWNDWAADCKTLGGFTFSHLSRLVARSWLRDGEVFIRHINSPDGYIIQPLEADYVPFEDYTSTLKPDPDGWVHGIRLDSLGRPLQYRLYVSHPGDTPAITLDYVVVPSDEIIHLKFVRRLHQVRGISILHGVISRLDDMKDVEESERIAMRVAASFAAVIKRAPFFDPEQQDSRSFEMAGGQVWNLLAEEEVSSIKSERPNTNLIPFIDAMINRVAAGTRTNAASISRNYNVSYSAQRQGMSDAAPGYDALFEYFACHFIRPVYERVIQDGVLRQKIPASMLRIPDAFKIDIRHQPLAGIDPLREAKAQQILYDMKVKSRHQIIRDLGGDPKTVDQQFKDDPYARDDTQTRPTKKNDFGDANAA